MGVRLSDQLRWPEAPVDVKAVYRVTLWKPWFLGWCRWSLTMTAQPTDSTGEIKVPIESGRWLWRGRRAPFMEMNVVAPMRDSTYVVDYR